jgi:hypothetical protein
MHSLLYFFPFDRTREMNLCRRLESCRRWASAAATIVLLLVLQGQIAFSRAIGFPSLNKFDGCTAAAAKDSKGHFGPVTPAIAFEFGLQLSLGDDGGDAD